MSTTEFVHSYIVMYHKAIFFVCTAEELSLLAVWGGGD